MSKSRVPSSRRKASGKDLKKSKEKSKDKSNEKLKDRLIEKSTAKFHRFIGISLSGGKSDKACVAVVEYFPEHKKIFLAHLYEKIKNEELVSADLKIHEIIAQFHDDVDYLAFDVPLTLPKCATCKLKCPGYETCTEPEMEWLREFYAEINRNKKPKKMFTPYTQRGVEAYVSHALEENFEIHHALGSNLAPLAARARFVLRRLNLPSIEVFPKLSVWRIGNDLKVPKSHLRFHRHAVGGDESRAQFLQKLAEKKEVFIYQQDMKSMVENNHAFEAFICAYTAYFKFMNQTEQRPTDFPDTEAWIEFPKVPGS